MYGRPKKRNTSAFLLLDFYLEKNKIEDISSPAFKLLKQGF